MTQTRTLQERLAQFAGDARVTMTNGSAGQLLMTAGALTAEAVTALDAKDALLREASEVLGACESDFERVRQILVNHLEEPERRAFWGAVRGRDRAATFLLKLTEAQK